MLLQNWTRKLFWNRVKAKNIRRSEKAMKRFAFIGMTLGVASWISVFSIMTGLQNSIREKTLDQKPHLLWEGAPRSDSAQKIENIRQTLSKDLISIEALLQSEGLLEIPREQNRGRVSGSGILIQGVEGYGDSVALGKDIIDEFSLSPGDSIRILSAWSLQSAPMELQLTDIVQTQLPELDRFLLRMDKTKLENFLGLNGAVSRIEIKLKDPFEAEKFKHLTSEIWGEDFNTWQEVDASLWYSLKLEKIVMTLALFVVLLLSSIAIHLALSVRVVDKIREVSLLRALGAPEKQIVRLFVLEGVLLGTKASFLGLILAYFSCRLIERHYDLPDFFYFTSIPVDWNWYWAFGMTLCGVLLSLLASWMPSKRALHFSINDGLKA